MKNRSSFGNRWGLSAPNLCPKAFGLWTPIGGNNWLGRTDDFRFQRSGQKQNGDKFGLFFQINSGKLPARHVKQFPQAWVQGGHLPGGAWGKAPPFSSLLSPNFHFMRSPCLTKYLRLNKPARSCIMAVARNRADREEAYVRKNRRAARRGPTGSRD